MNHTFVNENYLLILCRYGEADRPPPGGTAGLEDVLHTLRQVSVFRRLHVLIFCTFICTLDIHKYLGYPNFFLVPPHSFLHLLLTTYISD